MANNVNHGKRQYKQMALEVAVRNPERYEGILKSFAKNEGIVLNDKGILDVYAQLYLDAAVTTSKLSGVKMTKNTIQKWIRENLSHNNEWGFPTGYQAAFTRYLKTLSEFGFIYAQYNQELRLSPIAKALVDGKITLSEAFAVQSMRFWRKSPYRNNRPTGKIGRTNIAGSNSNNAVHICDPRGSRVLEGNTQLFTPIRRKTSRKQIAHSVFASLFIIFAFVRLMDSAPSSF